MLENLPPLRTSVLPEGSTWYRVYDATWGYDEHNPGYGDARFSPIDDPLSGSRLPSMYLAATPEAALLETVFHDVHQNAERLIYERDLRGMLLAHVRVPAPAVLADLRNQELGRLSIGRPQIVTSVEEHYPCTRSAAVAVLQQSREIQGLIWHSRQAELAGHPPQEVIALFGVPRYSTVRGSWVLFGPGASSLYDGPGRLLAEEIAEALDATIVLEA